MRIRVAPIVVAICLTVVVAAAPTAGLVSAEQTSTSTDLRGGKGFCADLPDAIGLYKGNPVTQMGVQVGSVSKITAEGDHVRVDFALNDGRAYPATVKAVTRSKSLLADRSVELVGNYHGGPRLEHGRCIALQDSFTPKSISEITGSASDFLKSLSDNGRADLQQTLEGLTKSLNGTGATANSFYERAASAARNPDDFVANVGSSIADMAPLTDRALQDFGPILHLVEQMPTVVPRGEKLFYNVVDFDEGVGWTVGTIYDIQRNYGSLLWPIVQGPVKDLVAVLAARAPDLQKLYAMVPAIAATMNQQQAAGGMSVPYKAPGVQIASAQCTALRLNCQSGRTTSMNLFTLLLDAAGGR